MLTDGAWVRAERGPKDDAAVGARTAGRAGVDALRRPDKRQTRPARRGAAGARHELGGEHAFISLSSLKSVPLEVKQRP